MENNKFGWDNPGNDVAQNYINKCKLFCENDEFFKNFRQDPDYKKILEGYDEGGDLWLSMITNKHGSEKLNEKLELLKRNDIYCSPTIRNVKGVGEICPYTLKYAGNALDITKEFGINNFNKIVEVGVGFGSMCLIMDGITNFSEYVLIDLPEVISLSKKYLSYFPDLYNKCTFIDCKDLEKIDKIDNVDLFISDSALTECNSEIQIMYYQKIIKESKFGYIVYNTSHTDMGRNAYNHLLKNINNDFYLNIENREVNYLYLKSKIK